MKKLRNRIGIMQGRLSKPLNDKIQAFPTDTWKAEFDKASKLGFEIIEWIFDDYPMNPIMNSGGINEIQNLSADFNIDINAVCADFFMTHKIFGVSKMELQQNIKVLKNLIEQCHTLGIKIIEIPLVDSSSILKPSDEEDFLVNISQALSYTEQNDVYLTLETDLPAIRFKNLVARLDNSYVKVNYDVGNSTSLGFDVSDEILILDKLISNIHIKDRLLHGKSVPLGKGNANFESFFDAIQKIEYKGDFIIQGAREDLENSLISPETTCGKYLGFVRQYVDKYLKLRE